MSETTTRSNIVLVEDNPADVYLFRMALQNAKVDFELTVIDDGAEALAFARQQGKFSGAAPPSLVVMDLNLPKNGGVEVLKAMRANPRYEKVPVVVASSSASPRERIEAEKFGVSRYILKPPDLESFMQIGLALKELLAAERQ